ncbi:MAG: hypothetical protein AMQ22_01342 [Candidatus Methanofastidiosum methylothiophilum]|uniref:GIY-YIG domain-containing protein n=1 Tax=Candidatus Methanofastidiosum methylothiophilum TaxID=1705564 RepID=A0A150J1W0_9EURY|nr:MAG: hypothetical protein AMQ22_01342 [Candidatus Methanofastidiosum methylthiophilus]
MKDAQTHKVCFSGGFLRRGFWLYVWEVKPPRGRKLYYVGRTGDSSSTNAQSPFNRMGQHLGYAENSCMLRRHLRDKHHIDPASCRFRLVAFGPVLPEAKTKKQHTERRNVVAALEKALAEAVGARHEVMNVVRSRQPLDQKLFARVRRAFAAEFPEVGG